MIMYTVTVWQCDSVTVPLTLHTVAVLQSACVHSDYMAEWLWLRQYGSVTV